MSRPLSQPGQRKDVSSKAALCPQSGQTSSVAQERVRWSAGELIAPPYLHATREGHRHSQSVPYAFPSYSESSRGQDTSSTHRLNRGGPLVQEREIGLAPG